MLISAPSKEEINNLIKIFNAQKYKKAIALAIKFTKKFPRHPFGWKALGVALKQTGNIQNALELLFSDVELPTI